MAGSQLTPMQAETSRKKWLASAARDRECRLDCAGLKIDRLHIEVVGHAMSRCLRHNRSLIVNACGFAWLDDLISIMHVEEQVYATAAQVFYVLAKDKKLRFQLV